MVERQNAEGRSPELEGRLEMGGEAFSLRPSMAGGWETVAKALGRKLQSVQDAGPAWCVTLSVADEQRDLYSQAFVAHGEPVYAEVVSDRFLEDMSRPLSAEQRAGLAAAGWTDPAVTDNGHSWPNWYRYFAGSSRWDDAAHAMVFALAAIVGVGDSEVVRLQVFPATSGHHEKEDAA